MAGLVPAIHKHGDAESDGGDAAANNPTRRFMGGRDKPGHDGRRVKVRELAGCLPRR
jgi:hypothetical protein